MSTDRKPRVILWGPGQVGVAALRAIIGHPGLELAGVVVHGADKHGRDAGELCGMPETGVIATPDIDAALAVPADVVAYFASGDYRYTEAAHDIARCLRAGKNVVCTSLVPMCYPPAADAETVELLEAACAAGKSSFFNSGVDPGWVNDILPLVLSGFCSHIDSITMQEILDYGGINQPDIMFDFMGFAHPPDAPVPLNDTKRLQALWAPVVHLLADGLGLTLDSVVTTSKAWVSDSRYEVASGVVEAGTVGAMRFRVEGIVDGASAIVLEHITRMGEHSAPEWPKHPSPLGGYRVIVEGVPTYTLDLEMHGRGSNLRGLTYATVMRELNAIPAVIAARPGLLSSLDLPLVTGPIRGGRWRGVLPAEALR
ncbi:NAD(P)H-dependent amine dehydrogenase family protein [Nocardia vaccinii]|uniref:NAD(P)H-dependent amine dehydrogenase family protein n=1 Tax=Nocardia vaccinii TaxID=1822 RepID=UPI000A8024EA|nr:dihydrodipicolinate reductase [Nocardia vaccinii]